MSLTQCRRCGGQISSNSTTCPWCGHATTFNLVGPLLLVVMVLLGISFALGFVRWEWLERTLGLDRGFIEQVQTADATAASGAAGGGGGDLSWRLPPGPDPAENQGASAVRGRRARPGPVRAEPPVAPARIASVARTGRSAPVLPGSPGCADSSAVARLISRYPAWSDSDLGLIACGSIRSGFSAEQVRASLGKPGQITAAGPGRQQWRYDGLSVIVEQGRVISYGQ